MIPFFAICQNLSSEMWPNILWKTWYRFCFEVPQTVGTTVYLFWLVLTLKTSIWIYFNFSGSYMVNSKTNLRVHKIAIFKRLRCNLFKTNIIFNVRLWDGIWRVACIVINWYHRIYNINYLGIYHVAIGQFHIGFSWDKKIKLKHIIGNSNIFSSVFMKTMF